MGVYIKGLNMPTVGRILITLPSGRTLEVSADNTQNILGEAKAVPVPPHGRVIDADALVEDLKRQCEEVFKINAVSPDDFWITRDHAYNERLWKTWCESFFEYLKERDTIIPASEEDER